jgi:nucleoside-diphosphate-sugar epimerase
LNRVLVTGAEGFTGKYLVDALIKKGYFVIPLALNSTNVKNCDLTDKQAVKDFLIEHKPEYIIHLAAISFVEHHDQQVLYSMNIFSTLNLLEAAHEIGLHLEKFIVSSSANVYGNYSGENPITELTPPAPVNHYAASKLSRPFNYTGHGQRVDFLVPKIVKHFKERAKIIELGNVAISRDFSDVHDIASYYVSLLDSDVHSEVINLCSGKVESIANILKYMSDIAGYEIEVKVNPNYVRENDIVRLGGNNSKLHTLTRLVPKYTMLDTLHEMYNNWGLK